MDFLDLKSIKSIIHGFWMDLDSPKKSLKIHEIHEIHELRATILIIRNDDKLIIYYQFIIVSYD